MSSSKLFLVARICLIGGALLILLGALAQALYSAIQVTLSLGAIGVLLIVPGFFLYKKASANRRRFEWRESYVAPQHAK
ncbi:MAG: hypothetical protein ACRECH_04820 [Nitrososphaerales archaeon]